MISKGTIKPSPEKLEAIKKLPFPSNISELRSFLGMTGYYRRFVKDYAKIAAPLNRLFRKDSSFAPQKDCNNSFETLKNTILDNAVLHRPDFSKPFLVQVDWSRNAIGAVLSQIIDDIERPILLQSRSLTDAEKNYSPAEGEALAAVWDVSTFRPYIHGSRFTLETDCSALTWLKIHPFPPPKLARWLLKLSEFDFEIKHRSGTKNANADALS